MATLRDITLSQTKQKEVELLQNKTRRGFLRLIALGGTALALTVASRKVNDIVTGGLHSKKQGEIAKKVKLSESLSFAEDNKEFVFFDKDGSELLVFEK